MSKEMVISANPHETRVAILEEGQLCEYYVEREKEFALVGSIYKGRVTRVLPGMQSAFVEIGLDSDAFLYVTDFLEGIEEFDEHVVTTVEEKIQKMEEQGGQIFPASAAAPALEPADVEAAPAPFARANGRVRIRSRDSVGACRAPTSAAVLNTASPDRPQFESRSPRPDRGGRDFGTRGGGRRGGRFGRRDNRGGRGGAEAAIAATAANSRRRNTRRLGLTKTNRASPRCPSDYVPIILPGESLAKYKEKPPSAAPPASAEENISNAEAQIAAPEAAAAVQEPPASSFSAPVVEAAAAAALRISAFEFRPRAASGRVAFRNGSTPNRGSSTAETIAAREAAERSNLTREERQEEEREIESRE